MSQSFRIGECAGTAAVERSRARRTWDGGSPEASADQVGPLACLVEGICSDRAGMGHQQGNPDLDNAAQLWDLRMLQELWADPAVGACNHQARPEAEPGLTLRRCRQAEGVLALLNGLGTEWWGDHRYECRGRCGSRRTAQAGNWLGKVHVDRPQLSSRTHTIQPGLSQ